MIKVCGITTQANLDGLSDLDIDFIGLNFYEKSKRHIENKPILSRKIPLVGVFVNASHSFILDKVNQYKLSYVQLHGNETPEFCHRLSQNTNVIKSIGIDKKEDVLIANSYDHCQYLLFDKKSPEFGGTGRKFDWELLNQYNGSTPFFIAGGIGPNDLTSLLKINHPKCIGIDINSQFETEPGIKNIKSIEAFIEKLKTSPIKSSNI